MINTSPSWMELLFKTPLNKEVTNTLIDGHPFIIKRGIARSKKLVLESQNQTKETFSYKWKKLDTFNSQSSLKRMREWLIERYGDIANSQWLKEHGDNPLLLDAGCGAGMSALELFKPIINNLRYFTFFDRTHNNNSSTYNRFYEIRIYTTRESSK